MGLAFLITTENLQLLGERKVLKEAEYAAVLDASQVVDAARAEARAIVARGVRQAADNERKAYEEGLQRARQEYSLQLVSEAMASQRQLRALRAAMAGIVVKAVGQFIAEADPAQLLEAALLRVDALIRSEPFVSVRVSPAQETTLRRVLAKLRDESNWQMNVTVQADPALADGACVVHTGSGTLEVGIDAQIEAFRKAVEHNALAEAGGPR
jgi:type III secretion protein L